MVLQLGSNAQYVDMEARNYFHKGMLTSKLKCIAKINHHRIQNATFNKGLVYDRYLRYTEKEDWYHVI